MTKENLRIVFMGTPEFAVPSLKALVNNNYNVVGVITSPDKKAGRGKKVRMSAIKIAAIENNLNILQPTNLKDENFIAELKSLKANLQIVVAFRMLPEVVWSMPELGTFNLHASLLPQYRGAAPINYALINGETKTGLTTFFLDKEIDTGKIIKQVEISINIDDNVGTLHDRMMDEGAKLVLNTTNSIVEGNIELLEQSALSDNNEVLKTANKLTKESCRINWNDSSETIYNFVRGLSPYPAAFNTLQLSDGTEYNLKIYKVSIEDNSQPNLQPGDIQTDSKNFLTIITKTGSVNIIDLQLSGKKRMRISDFLRGFKGIEGSRLF